MTEPRWAPGGQLGDAEWEALARYAAGESTPEEASAIRTWLEQDPARSALLELLEQHAGRLQSSEQPIEVEAAWRRVAVRMEEPAVLAFAAPEERTGPAWRRTALRVAAAIVLLVAGAALWRVMVDVPAQQQFAEARQFQTGVGQTDTVQLVDGSRIVLAPLSRLTVDAAYNSSRREVTLTGEALFEVQHDDTRPFRVRAGQAIVEDLGTIFSVREAGEDGVQVAVIEGVVKLESVALGRDTGAVLDAGSLGVLDGGGNVHAERITDASARTAWTQHRIVFNDARYTEVARELHRWYGIELRTSDPAIESQRLTATFAGESAQDVLNILALAFGARIEQRGDTAVVRALRAGEQR